VLNCFLAVSCAEFVGGVVGAGWGRVGQVFAKLYSQLPSDLQVGVLLLRAALKLQNDLLVDCAGGIPLSRTSVPGCTRVLYASFVRKSNMRMRPLCLSDRPRSLTRRPTARASALCRPTSRRRR
jgi:hypothetical protein